MGKNNKKKLINNLPFVSVCTPTYNRRPFINMMIQCFNNQDYPKEKLEWIILDDGTDPIEDLVKDIPNVNYSKYKYKMKLGEKRNLMHKKCKGDIIVYMDDDDYYPPERISHAVKKLQSDSKVLCAGSSELYIYFKNINELYQFGPYGKNHATAGTFAFKKKMLENSSYNNNAALAEEKEFLNGYTVPFIQLDPLKTILVFSHRHNTYNKEKLLINANEEYVKKSDKTVDLFIKDKNIKEFYMNEIDKLLINYKPGEPEMKPDVLKQIAEMEEFKRLQLEKELIKIKKENTKIAVTGPDGKTVELTNDKIVNILQQQQLEIERLKKEIIGKNIEISMLEKLVKNNI
jgi:glycosyltransferase involved in cell wall biosynthesis